jgi:Fe-S oxidoreductase
VHDLIKVLAHKEIPYVVVEKQACCGLPKLELGDLKSVAELSKKNMPILSKLAREGYGIVAPIPSCTRMFKQEIPLMFPELEAYNPLIPDGRNFKCTMMIEFPDPEIRKVELGRLKGVDHPHYQVTVDPVAPETRAALVKDLA